MTDRRADSGAAADPADPRPLVLVAVGTDHHPFTRLIDWADTYAAERPEVRVLVQHGATPAPGTAEGVGLIDRDRLGAAMRAAAAVVTHGGPATISEARAAGRLPIAVARDPELGEHVDDHQLRFVARLDSARMVRSCSSYQQFAATVDKALAQPADFRVAEEPGEGPEAVALRAGRLIDLLIRDTRADRPLPAAPPPGAPDTPEWPDVTVVVPTRDRPDLLRRTLRHIAGQDYPGTVRTLVVYDQEEPDPALARTGGSRPVGVLRNTGRPGLAGARNTGVLAAGTELVAFCDDDDTWLPGKLRAQVEVMRAEPETELVCCGIRVVYGHAEAERVLDRTCVEFGDLLRSRLTELHPSTFLLRRSALVEGAGGVNEEIPGSYAEDYELLLRLARRGPIRNVPAAHVRVLWHARSHFGGRWQTISTALRWLLAAYPEFRLVPRGFARVAGQIAFAEAAAGRRAAALEWAVAALRAHPGEARAYLAAAVTCGLPPGVVLRALHRRGRGL
ncbi:glycosyltransferase [Streptomonospora nanhaiensis]|uniref:UDP-N-acetylglucosamine transferase subunit ALG13/GT2 family glycosyltransferase n=1 Tax=Streptomonospora nanhaiensis TaxID=1323731 RepID=A0A853BN34_9ACTN|nr:glycosyltransferase [Streptomonospora nanhaiensis]MBX9386736.1 glycosyltransferase [Streptomonospora nanhaiensis]NYI96144.1 UDP-N-acetylglucosamine transferase subunit ALG13/GT2 family glycosyltransferase [Streptomonospora nanhaiensis]